MIDPEERKVLKLLHKYKNGEDLPEYPLMDRKFVKAISETITDVIYDSYKNKSLSSKNTRQTFIGLLEKWIDPSSYILLDESNYYTLVHSLIKKPDVSCGENVFKDLSNIKEEFKWENICESLNKSYITSLEEKIKIGLIQTWHKKEFEKTDFDFTLSNKTYQNADMEMLMEFLRNVKTDIKQMNNYDNTKVESPMNLNIKASVRLGHALINFERNSDNEKLFLRVLGDISSSKTEVGSQFIDYIWENRVSLTLSSNISVTILKKFKYLLEKQIITLATDILENLNAGSKQNRYEILIQHSGIENTLEICALDVELCQNVISILNKLLTLSKFDERLFKLLKIIQTYFQNE